MLIKSISGIRGTIGGKVNENLTPIDIVKFTTAYAQWLSQQTKTSDKKKKVVVGRDARISGSAVYNIVIYTLNMCGIDVVALDLSTTPTVEMSVTEHKADGGIIITASHNPVQWNALKLLNHLGEFISDADGKKILEFAETSNYTYADVLALGNIIPDNKAIDKHIEKILTLKYVDVAAIKSAAFTIVIDAVNSTGGIAVPKLLKQLGVKNIIELYCEPTGHFPHNPEPLPEHLSDLASSVKKHNAHLGISVDPDVDRLAFICEDGEPFGEEYTLVAVADYILKANKGGNTVSNLSSTQALRDVTTKHKGTYNAAAVGEVNVVTKMKETNAIIGGEGNGGVILPELHYGRDALAGIAIFLTHLAKFKKSTSILRDLYPRYFISKNKIELSANTPLDTVLEDIKTRYKKYPINTEDGVKIELSNTEWVHLRKSNTEPIIRIYSESQTQTTADNLAKKMIADIKEIIKEKQNSLL